MQGNSRGFGFVSYDTFEASDAAVEAMNGQYLCNRPITVTYAYKKACPPHFAHTFCLHRPIIFPPPPH